MEIDKKTKEAVVRVTLRVNGYKSVAKVGGSFGIVLPRHFTNQALKFADKVWIKYYYDGKKLVLEPASESEVKELLSSCGIDWEC